MVLELIALTGLPVAIATVEGVRHQTEHDRRRDEQYYMRDFHIDVYCTARSRKRSQVDRTMVVLKHGKLYLAPKDPETKQPKLFMGSSSPLHPFTGFYLDYQPRKEKHDMFERLNKPPKIRGLVTTISNSPPTLNWVYIDRNTLEVKYGSREVAQGHILGPWDWTDDEVGLTLEGWEGFVAVEEKRDVWAIYFDRDDDCLQDIVNGKRVLQCSLERMILEDEVEEVVR